jgi:hypothetical protein
MKGALVDNDALAEAPGVLGNPIKPASAGKDARKESRVKVNWAARAQLPNGRIAELRVRDLCDEGIGLSGEVGIPPHSILTFAMAVPGLNDPAATTSVVGTIKTSHATVRGQDLIYISPESMGLVKKWIRRLRS